MNNLEIYHGEHHQKLSPGRRCPGLRTGGNGGDGDGPLTCPDGGGPELRGLSWVHRIPSIIIYHHLPVPYAPWCWNSCLQNWVIIGANVGIYSYLFHTFMSIWVL